MLLGRNLAEIVLLDVEHARERNAAGAHGGVFGVVHGLHVLDLAFGIIVDHDAQRAQHGHYAGGALVEIFTDEVFEQRQFGATVRFRNADAAAEIANCFGRVTAAAHSGDGGHTRIVPAGNVAL